MLCYPAAAVGIAPPSSADWGSLTYFIGALCFQVAVIVAVVVPSAGHATKLFLEYLPQAIGGFCFFLASIIEFEHNIKASWRERVWWLCTFYLLGSALFFGAAMAALLHSYLGWDASLGSLFVVWAVDLPCKAWRASQADAGIHQGCRPERSRRTELSSRHVLADAVGSFAFWCGAWVQLFMWRSEQFGLGTMAQLLAAATVKIDTSTCRPLPDTPRLMSSPSLACTNVFTGFLSEVNESFAHGRDAAKSDGVLLAGQGSVMLATVYAALSVLNGGCGTVSLGTFGRLLPPTPLVMLVAMLVALLVAMLTARLVTVAATATPSASTSPAPLYAVCAGSSWRGTAPWRAACWTAVWTSSSLSAQTRSCTSQLPLWLRTRCCCWQQCFIRRRRCIRSTTWRGSYASWRCSSAVQR